MQKCVSYATKPAGACSGKATPFTKSQKESNSTKEYKSKSVGMGKLGMKTQG